ERDFYSEAHRVLKPNGTLIVEYINEIFDVATFNRFTVNFYKKHLLPAFFSDPQKIEDLSGRIANLLQFPEKPDLSGKYVTTRDQVFTRSDNPLTFKNRAERFGFEQTDLLFYRFHAVPPLLFEENPDLEKVAIQFERKYCRHWIGYFTASGF